jgi:hypothetical protein
VGGCCVPDFETAANRDSWSTFDTNVAYLPWSIRSSARKYFPALAGLVGPVHEDNFPYWPKLSPSLSSMAGQYTCLFYVQSRGLHITMRCRLSWLTNSAFVYKPKRRGRGGVAGSQPMTTDVHRSPNKICRTNSIFNLWFSLRA